MTGLSEATVTVAYQDLPALPPVTVQFFGIRPDVEQIAEAVFIAFEAPLEVIESDTLSRQVYRIFRLALTPEDQVRSLMVGDRVRIDDTELRCESVGWAWASTAE